jgi:hypothetical protein
MHATLDPQRTAFDLALLDELIAQVPASAEKEPNQDPQELLAEHLNSARAYMLGAMSDEYVAALDTAEDAARHLSDPGRRRFVIRKLQILRGDVSASDAEHAPGWRHSSRRRRHSGAPEGAQNELWKFFNVTDDSFGSFYPKNHIIAVFQSIDTAQRAEDALRVSGFREDETVSAPGEAMLQFLTEFRRRVGLWGNLMESVSRFFGTEEAFVDSDVRWAREGASFLAVYCPVADEAERVRDLIAPHGPIAMHQYLAGGIVSLI